MSKHMKWFAKAIYIVIAVALVLGFALAPATPTQAAFGTYAGYDFYRDQTGTATWETAQKYTGNYSVLLNAPTAGTDYARVKIPITSTAFSTFAAPSFWYRDGGATVTTADIGATWPILVKSADTVTTGYLSPYPMLGIDDGVTPVTLMGQSWASATAPAWTQWLNATASKVATEALWHDGFTTDPALGGTIPAFYAPLSWWQTNASSPYKTGYNVLSVRVGLGYFGAGCAAQKAYVDTVSGSTYDLEPVVIENPCYNTGQTVNFKILNGTATGVLPINVASTTIPAGITIVTTAGVGGVFNGTLTLVNTTPTAGQLVVNNGDTVTVTYSGNWYTASSTGPPAGPGNLIATAKVDDTAPVVTSTPANGTRVSGATVNIDPNITETNAHTDTLTIDGAAKTFADPYVWDTTTYADGAHTVVLTSTDCAGNVGTNTKSYTVDNTRPGVTLTSAATSPTNLPIPVRATFTEAVAAFVAGNITLGGVGGTVTTGPTYVSPGVYDFTVTPGGQGVVTIDIAAGVVNDIATPANTNTVSNTLTYTYDTVGPTVTINQAGSQTDPTNNSPVNFTVVFSETVTDFATGDVAFTGSTAPGTLVGTVTGTGTTYNVAVSGMTGSGNVVASILTAVAHDAAGNNSAASTSTDNTVTYNQINPTCTLTSVPAGPEFNVPLACDALFSLPVTGFEAADIAVTNGAISAFTQVGGVGDHYTFTVTPPAQGAVTVQVPASCCQDIAGSRPNVASNLLSLTYDTIAPTVVLTAPNTCTNPFNLIITFSEAVLGFAVGDVTLTNATPGTLSAPVGNVYTLPVTVTNTANPMTAQVAAAKCQDAATNPNTASNLLTAQYSANGINLAKDWNLMSPNLIPNDPTIGVVLGDISTDVLAVWYYDATVVAPADRWKGWSPINPTPTLTTMEDGKGYQVRMANARTLIIDGLEQPAPGSMLPPPSYDVVVGWNMIGFKSLTTQQGDTYLAGVATKYTKVYRFDNSAAQAYVVVNTAAAGSFVPGEGYWAAFTAAGTIYP